MRFARLRRRPLRVRRTLVAARLVLGVLGVVGVLGVLGGGRALASVSPPPAAPLAGSASAALTQVNAGEWTTTIYLDTAALCAGTKPAGNSFTLVTGKPASVTSAASPAYPDGPLACGTVAADPVTEVKLTFTPSPALSAVPQTATLAVTPPPALLQEGDRPVQIPLTVRRTVSPWQYVGIPAICGGTLTVLLVLALVAVGVPAMPAAEAAPPKHVSALSEQARAGQPPGRADFSALLLLYLMTKGHEVLVTELPGTGALVAGAKLSTDGRLAVHGTQAAELAWPVNGAVPAAVSWPPARTQLQAVTQLPVPAVTQPPARADRKPERVRWSERVHWGLAFWETPLFAGAAWSFGTSWATSVTPLTGLAGGVLTASGAVAGLVPGVDLTRFGLLMVLAGALTTLAPLLFGALNSLFPAQDPGEPVPAGEVIAARLWVMLLPSCLTVFAVGAEIGLAGLVLGFNLIVVSPSVRWIGPAAAALAALLFLVYGVHSLLTLAGEPSGSPRKTARKSSFMI